MFHRLIPIYVMRASLFTSLLALWTLGLAPEKARAIDAALGLGIVEEGDDHIRSGLTLQAHLQGYGGTIHYWGESYGPVSTDSYLIALDKSFTILKTPQIVGGIGLAALNERISLDFDAKDEARGRVGRDREEDNFNIGVAFSLSWRLSKAQWPVFMAVNWDSYVFPAGLDGGIFLSSGRKQILSITFGYGV